MRDSLEVRRTASVALSAADRAFLAWEAPDRPMHVGLLATFRAASADRIPSIEQIRASIEAAVRSEPRLMGRLRRGRFGAATCLVPTASFCIADHVRVARFAPSDAGTELERKVDALLARPLDLGRPLWEIWVLSGRPSADCFTLVCKFHHALLDGSSGVALIERVLCGVAPREAPDGSRRAHRPSRRRAGIVATLRAGGRLLRTMYRRGPATELNGRVRAERHHRAIQCDLERLDAGAAKLGGTRNDALLAAVAGALRSTLAEVPHSIRAFCPVSVRARGDRDLGNRVSLWILDLPVHEPDLEPRIRQVRASTMRAKRSGDAAGGQLLERLTAVLGVWTARVGMALAAWRRVYQIVVTNVSGPARELSLLGTRLVSLVPFAPLFPGQRVAVAAIAYAGRLHVGVSDGFGSAEIGDRLASRIARELDDVASRSDLAPTVVQRSA